MTARDKKSLYRLIDANYNRSKEALRVCEDICRFLWNHKRATRSFKKIRHQLTQALDIFPLRAILPCRDIQKDVGKGSLDIELKRKEVSDIFYANMQRAKESVRVLEEFAKLVNASAALSLKKIRYQIYALEKKIVERM